MAISKSAWSALLLSIGVLSSASCALGSFGLGMSAVTASGHDPSMVAVCSGTGFVAALALAAWLGLQGRRRMGLLVGLIMFAMTSFIVWSLLTEGARQFPPKAGEPTPSKIDA